MYHGENINLWPEIITVAYPATEEFDMQIKALDNIITFPHKNL
jgi:hypothetical protein